MSAADREKVVIAIVTVISLLVVFFVNQFAPESVEDVRALLGDVGPLIITIILAVTTVQVAQHYREARIEVAEIQASAAVYHADAGIQAATASTHSDATLATSLQATASVLLRCTEAMRDLRDLRFETAQEAVEKPAKKAKSKSKK